MKSYSFVFLLALVASCVNAFSSSSLSGTAGGSAFVVSQRPRSPTVVNTRSQRSRSASVSTSLQMGSMAQFGIFSPAVYAAKIVLGQDRLNKIRGKAISLHSQQISDFAEWVGAYHLRTKLIKKAKQNGDKLGFLV